MISIDIRCSYPIFSDVSELVVTTARMMATTLTLTSSAFSQAVIQLIRTDKWSEEVQRDWKRLRKASEAVRNDKELVMACMDASGGEAIKYAGEDWLGFEQNQQGWCLLFFERVTFGF